MHILDRWLIRWITRLIFLHLLICAGAMVGFPLVIFTAWEFYRDSMDAKSLAESGAKTELPLIRHPDERFFRGRGYRFFYGEGEFLVRFGHRDEPTQDLDYLTVYEEPLRDEPIGLVTEVPQSPSMQNVYEKMRRRTWFSGLRVVIVTFLGWLLILYIAVRGYFMIKGKKMPRVRRRRSR